MISVMATQDDFIRTALRVPPGLHKQIHDAAEKSNRTFNAEIVARLQDSFERPALPVLHIDLTANEETRMKDVREAIDALKPYIQPDQPLEVRVIEAKKA